MGCVGFTDFVDFVDFVGIIPDLAFVDFHSASSPKYRPGSERILTFLPTYIRLTIVKPLHWGGHLEWRET